MTEAANLEPTNRANEWVRNESVSVGTSVVEVAPARRRKMILVRNTSATQTITVTMGGVAAIANAGMVLGPSESFADSNSGDNYECYQGQYTAIGDAAGGTLAVVER